LHYRGGDRLTSAIINLKRFDVGRISADVVSDFITHLARKALHDAQMANGGSLHAEEMSSDLDWSA
jgi:hypothetical protein